MACSFRSPASAGLTGLLLLALGFSSLPVKAQGLLDKVNDRMTAVDPETAEGAADGSTDGVANDDPVALLTRSALFTSQLPRATIDFAYRLDIAKGDAKQQVDSSYRVLLAEGGRFAVGPTGGTKGPRVFSDGSEMALLPPGRATDAKRYNIQGGIAAFATGRPAKWIGHGLGGLTLSLLSPAASQDILAAVTDPVSLGKETIRVGEAEHFCHHGRVTTAELTWDYWIDAGDQPLLRRIVPDLSEEPEPDTPPEEVESAEITIDFKRWDLDTAPPAGAFLVGEPAHPMLGKKLPRVTLPLLGGGEQDLGELIGKKVIVLDFWATWCPPCVASLPTLDSVTQEYADRGVVAFAINAGEETEKIEEFLVERDWQIPIALDSDREINRVLKPGTGLPTKLVIGLDGRVQIAGAGVTPNMEEYREKLAEEFDALLAGKDLATDVVARWQAMKAVFPNK